jgi:hypothetical protein
MMIYEAILPRSQTDLEIFNDLRGVVNSEMLMYELNCLYKYDKETWTRKRRDAIRREIIEKQKEEEEDQRKKEEQKENDQKKNEAEQKREDPSYEEIEQQSSRHYAAYVYFVIKVHMDHPFLYKLINVFGNFNLKMQIPIQSCLHFAPEDRPGAVGILDYLQGKCTFEKIKVNPNPRPILMDETIDIITTAMKKLKKEKKTEDMKLKHHIQSLILNRDGKPYDLRFIEKGAYAYINYKLDMH